MVKTENELPILWQQHIMLGKCHSGPRVTKGKEPFKSRSINRLLSRLQTDRLHDKSVTIASQPRAPYIYEFYVALIDSLKRNKTHGSDKKCA